MITSLALATAGHFSAALLFYFFHRCIFHGPLGKWPVLKKWAAIHAAHHRSPHDPGAFFFPWWANTIIWALTVALCFASLAFGVGMLSFFVLYSYRHRAAHLGSRKRWARHHLTHHYAAPNSNFSGSYPFIDKLFNTHQGIHPEWLEHQINRVNKRRR